MADCPNVPTCRLYPLFKLAGTLRVWQINYCQSGFVDCERFKRTCRSEPVPDALLPNGKLLKAISGPP
jgi:hypothetical protein